MRIKYLNFHAVEKSRNKEFKFQNKTEHYLNFKLKVIIQVNLIMSTLIDETS